MGRVPVGIAPRLKYESNKVKKLLEKLERNRKKDPVVKKINDWSGKVVFWFLAVFQFIALFIFAEAILGEWQIPIILAGSTVWIEWMIYKGRK